MRILPLLFLTAGSLASPIPSTTQDTETTQVDRQLTGSLLDLGDPVTEVALGEYTFSNSWGAPYVTTYSPPAANFTHVRIKLEVSSSGIQYDRLARLYIGGAEVWRSSTAEPTGGDMSYSFTKDVTTYLQLFKSDQNVVFDLGNTVNSQFTGAYWTRLTVQFFSGDLADSNGDRVFDSYSSRQPANSIIPIRPKSELTSTAYCYTLPSESIDFAIDPLPKNTTRVVLDIFASGNGNDEFWYYNMLPQNVDAFSGLSLQGNYPSRIIQVTLGDEGAGLVLPFPIIFTGGFSPSLWIPNVGINAFDLPSYQIDLTPLLPKLWAGTDIKINITTGFGNLATSDWYVNANLLTWQTEGVTGCGNSVPGAYKNLTNSYTSSPDSSSLVELLSIARDVSTQAILNFTKADGTTDSAFVKSSQTMSYTNTKYFSNSGAYRQVAQVSSGHSMLHVSQAGADLSQFAGGIDSDTLPASFDVVFSDTDTNSDLELKTEWSYSYPLAITDASTSSSSQTDIFHGYMYNDAQDKGVYTRQNTTLTGSSPAASQYLIQRLLGLDGTTASTDAEYSETANYAVTGGWTDSPNVDSIVGWAENDCITSAVNTAATAAYNQKSDTGAVNAAVENIFSSVLPSISISKRSASASLLDRVKRTIVGLSRSPFQPSSGSSIPSLAKRAVQFAPARSPFSS